MTVLCGRIVVRLCTKGSEKRKMNREKQKDDILTSLIPVHWVHDVLETTIETRAAISASSEGSNRIQLKHQTFIFQLMMRLIQLLLKVPHL
jgi:hypothetical protein